VNDLKKVKALSEKGSGVEVARGVKTYYYGPNGNVKGILSAPVLYRYLRDTPYMLMDSGLKVDFYNDSLQLQTILTAKKGWYYEKTNDITVRDSVVVTTVEGKKLLTDELNWDPKLQQFYTYKPARLITEGQDVTADSGLVAPGDLSSYRLFKTSGPLKMDPHDFGDSADSTKTDTLIRDKSPRPQQPGPPQASRPSPPRTPPDTTDLP
jgi:LPS export ABC transporter protein LptC